MRIDGKAIADSILTDLTSQTTKLKGKGIVPTLAVILVGDNPGSLSYIKQKTKAAESVGATFLFEHLPTTTPAETLASAIAHFNNNGMIHGLIVQRPVPTPGAEEILGTVNPAKDIDGFIENSPFQVPVARAVVTILTHIHAQLTNQKLVRDEFLAWLAKQSIAVIGRGETAGQPIAQLLTTYGASVSVIHSQTNNPQPILKTSSIIISCVGKNRVVTKKFLQRGTILISVGLFRGKDGKLHGDYDEEEIAKIASFYTPTPGGVGPVNVASLMQNLLEATSFQSAFL